MGYHRRQVEQPRDIIDTGDDMDVRAGLCHGFTHLAELLRRALACITLCQLKVFDEDRAGRSCQIAPTMSMSQLIVTSLSCAHSRSTMAVFITRPSKPSVAWAGNASRR